VLLGGLVVDAIGSVLFVGVLASVLFAISSGGGVGIEAVAKSRTFTVAAALGGSLLVVAGGYTAAWWARRRPIALALCAGIVSLLAALPGFWIQRNDAGLFWTNVATLVLHLPLAVLGGYLWARSRPAA
jgi:hypothetical protein